MLLLYVLVLRDKGRGFANRLLLVALLAACVTERRRVPPRI